MQNLPMGLLMTVCGMGVTFISLFILMLICFALRKMYPYKEEEEGQGGD